MANQPIRQGEETHIGFQPNGPNGSADTDHLVIKDLSIAKGPQSSEPLIQFNTAEPIRDSNQESDSEQPQFLAVDDLGLESPIQLIGAQDCDEAQPIPIPNLISFDLDAREQPKSSDTSDNPLFS